MTRFFLITSLLMLVSVGFEPSTADAVDESVEPKLRYAVNVGDKIVTISEGETVQLDGTFTNPKLTVTPAPYRVFPYQLHFR